MTRQWQNRLTAAILPVGILLTWQGIAMLNATPLFPSPVRVAGDAIRYAPEILSELRHTLFRATLGLALAMATMIPFGIFLGRFRVIGAVMEPVIDMIATLPPPAMIPIVMLFAGTGDWAKIVVIAYAAGVPLLINAVEATRTVHPMLNRVGRSLRMGRLDAMLHIDLPASLPMIATGLRLAISASLLVSVTSEMLLATNGIGVFLQKRQELFQISAGLAGIAAISVMGVLINNLFLRLERRLLFWHYRPEDPS